MSADYYKVLRVERSAGQEEIKKAYKRLALKFHPDRNPDDPSAEEKFKQVSEAYRVLGDPERRARYDQTGDTGDDAQRFHEVDIATVAEFFENIFGDVFGLRRRKGRTIHQELEVSFEEAALGVTKTITVPRPVECESCKGSGAAPGTTPETCTACSGKGDVRYQQGLFVLNRTCRTCNGRGKIVTDPCPACRGVGRTVREETLTVRLPPGTDEGARRTIKGFGEVGPEGPGDLVIDVRVKAHELFTRVGHDITCSVVVTFPQAALGDEIAVPTIDGNVQMKVRPGTQPGQRYKLKGKGIPGIGGSRGDQLVSVDVDVPRSLTPHQEELIKELATELKVDLTPQSPSFIERLRKLISS
jgi:molecular chaperone DnaJ